MKALIIIDMFVRDIEKRRDRNKLISNQVKLMKAFRAARNKVIIAGGSKSGKASKTKNPVMLRLWGDESSPHHDKNKIVPELLNEAHDYYLAKSEYSIFFKTKLESYLKKNKIKEVYLGGIYSGCCVYFSAADAAMRGIQPFIVTDASGSVSDRSHKKNIKRFNELFGPAISTASLIKKIKKK